MDVRWIVQEDVFGEDLERLRKSILKSGAQCDVIKYSPFGSGSYDNYFHGEPTIVYGSLNLVQQILGRHKEVVPCAWCDLDNFKCSTYYAYLGEFLLNDRYEFLPLNEFKRLYSDTHLFIRPDAGDKPFSGHVVDMDDLDHVTRLCDPHTMIVCSSVKSIDKEWRFVVCDGSIVTGCQYMSDGELCAEYGYPNEALEAASKVVNNKHGWHPDSMYTVDIGQWGLYFGLVEINSFSCSGFYKCHTDNIVYAANKQAVLEYEDCYGI